MSRTKLPTKAEKKRIKNYATNVHELIFWAHLWMHSQGENVYIAGKVTGLDYEVVRDKFDGCANKLELRGYVAINPCDFVAPEIPWKSAMRLCIAALSQADYIWLLPDWENSKGARIEKELAEKMGIKILNPMLP